MNTFIFVKRFLFFLGVFFIFFLTGCAAARYDNARIGHVSAVSAAQLNQNIPSFSWPLNAKILHNFGALEEGVSLKGVVFDAFEGQEVKVSETGRVVFVDAGFRGYGKTIIVEHDKNYSTVYARNAQVLVRKGDWVRKGQVIARAGQDGKGNFPQVYFELRRDSKPLNPQNIVG